MRVSIPDGCILAQAGMEIEHLTGGYIMAGYHEVIVNERTLEQIEEAKNSVHLNIPLTTGKILMANLLHTIFPHKLR